MKPVFFLQALPIAGPRCYPTKEGAGGAGDKKILTRAFSSSTRLRAGTVITHLFSQNENF